MTIPFLVMAALKQLKIECPTREWNGDGSLTMFVMAQNLERRHLTKAQRGVAAARMVDLLEEEAAQRKKEAGKQYGRGRPLKNRVGARVPPPKRKEQTRATDQAAKAVGVSGRYVRDIKKIEKTAPELVEHVEADGDPAPACPSQRAQDEEYVIRRTRCRCW
jgi:hypothetical protein